MSRSTSEPRWFEQLDCPATTTLVISVGTFTCLAGGRITLGEGSIQIDGDAELATAVPAALAYTIWRGRRLQP